MREIVSVEDLLLLEDCTTVKVILPKTIKQRTVLLRDGMFQRLPFGAAVDKTRILQEMECGISTVFLAEEPGRAMTVEECDSLPDETVVTLKRVSSQVTLTGSIRKGRWHERGGSGVFNLAEKMRQGAKVYVYTRVEEIVEQAKNLQAYRGSIPLSDIASQGYKTMQIKVAKGYNILEGMLLDLYEERGREFLYRELPLDIKELAEAVDAVCNRIDDI